MELKDIKPGYSLKTKQMMELTGYSREMLREKAAIRGQRYAVKNKPKSKTSCYLWDYWKFMEHMERKQEETRKEVTHYDRSELGIRKYKRQYA